MILTPSTSLSLDIIRILAAQAVLIGHLIQSHKQFLWLGQPTNPAMENIAVVIFFLVSGFLIPMSVEVKLKQGNYRFIDYLRSRFTRIYAVFLPALFLVVILDSIALKLHPETYYYFKAFNVKTFFTNLFMLQYFPSVPFGSGRSFWSLPLWWWTYLSFGALVLAKNRWLTVLFLAIPVYSLFFGRGQGLVLVWLMGALIYYGLSRNWFSRLSHNLFLILAFILMLLAVIRVNSTLREYEIIFELLLSGSIGFLLHYLQAIKIKIAGKLTTVIRFFANYSLTLYLTHLTISVFILSFTGRQSSLPLFIFTWVICNLLAIVMAAFTEKKAL